MLHNFRYEFLRNLRQKELIGWMMIFPVILGTFFNLTFGSLYEKDELFTEIPVAVVNAESDAVFKDVMDSLSEGETPLFTPYYTDIERAEELLSEGEVSSIIHVDTEIKMTVQSEGAAPSIVRSFLDTYSTQKAIITETAQNNPRQLEAVKAAFSEEISCMDTKTLSGGNMDPYMVYFQNLIAMVALFAAINGVLAATQNQGNLSAIGARKEVAPTHRFSSMAASLMAAFAAQVICVFLSITYIIFVLKVDMGDKIPMIYLSGIIGSFAGTSMGFFIGSAGKASEELKTGIAFTVTMVSCFLSGLMIGTMKEIIAGFCPIINRINPAALISDLFYCLTIYDDYRRYTETASVLMIMSIIFIAAGFLLTRRKKYASI